MKLEWISEATIRENSRPFAVELQNGRFRVWIDAPRPLGLGCAPPLAETHGLPIENRKACGIDPEIGHPGFL